MGVELVRWVVDWVGLEFDIHLRIWINIFKIVITGWQFSTSCEQNPKLVRRELDGRVEVSVYPVQNGNDDKA